MTIQDYAAVAEIVGALAVVISLVYLAIQIRQNTRQLAMNTSYSELAGFERSVEAGNRIRELMILNPELANLFLRGCKNFKQLGEDERFRMDMLLRNMFSSAQGAFMRHEVLKNDPKKFAGTIELIESLLANPGVRQWLKRASVDWHPAFSDLVQKRLRAQEAGAPS